MASLNREDKQNKYFYIYDIFNERLIRKVRKIEKPLRLTHEESDAYDIDAEGGVIIYSSGNDFIF